jgi:stage II sporulation protein D
MRRLLLITALLMLPVPATAGAATRWVVKGGGWGHGLGMSQYGAYGQALAGRDYRTIVHHYYSHTKLGTAKGSVRVLLLASVPSVTFGGANRVGSKSVRPGRNYTAVRAGGAIVIKSARGKRVARSTGVLRVMAPNGIVTVANKSASYRDVIELRPGASGGVTAVNKVELEHYVRGVVPNESPASWPLEALKAQAVAARSYALGTNSGNPVFDQYDTTASQVYGGYSSEDYRTNRAVARTDGEVLRYRGKIITAYFHSTSGGHTEDNENIFPGTPVAPAHPLPYIRGVPDPWDKYSPYHHWKVRYTAARLGAALGVGRLRRVTNVSHGASPRIVWATFRGSGGHRRLHGYRDVKAILGLRDAPSTFKRISAHGSTARAAAAGVGVFAREVSGSIAPAAHGAKLIVQRRSGGRWQRVATGRIGRGGSYRVAVERRGLYRVVAGGDAGPAVRVR